MDLCGLDGTFGNRYDDPAGEYRVLYAAGERRGAFLETLARFRVDLQLVAEMDAIDGDERDDAFPTVGCGVVPSEWLARRRIGMATAASLWLVDIAHSESLAHLREHLLRDWSTTALTTWTPVTSGAAHLVRSRRRPRATSSSTGWPRAASRSPVSPTARGWVTS